MMKKIILASSSPQRQEILKMLGFEFTVESSGFDESRVFFADPYKLAKALALGKAKKVAERSQNAIVIGADTIVVCDDEVFGKPRDAKHAKEMLKKLNGKTHSVVTGFSIYDADTHKFLTDAVETKVYFRPLHDYEVDAYVKSGEPFGKAGGYAIQGLAAFFTEKIEGDYYNIVGLPIATLAKRLTELGVFVPEHA